MGTKVTMTKDWRDEHGVRALAKGRTYDVPAPVADLIEKDGAGKADRPKPARKPKGKSKGGATENKSKGDAPENKSEGSAPENKSEGDAPENKSEGSAEGE